MKTKHPLYRIFCGMRNRCLNSRCSNYRNYGGRGIKICKRWSKFENFAKDMGPRPAGYTLDRIDNNGNYEPSNCRWATPLTQGRNTRSNTWITALGRTQLLVDWCRETGMSSAGLYLRRKNGLSWDECLSIPNGSLVKKNSSSGVQGVIKVGERFRATTRKDGKAFWLGTFDSIPDALAAIAKFKGAA